MRTSDLNSHGVLRRAILLTIAFVMAAATVKAQPEEPLVVHCEWASPADGEPAVHYLVAIMDIDGGLDEVRVVPARSGPVQSCTFELDYLRRYVVRVRGVDSDGDEGPWSLWSPVYAFEMDSPEP